MHVSPNYDAIIIGGGPAGASTGAILGEYGHRVLILEREKFPRYHIGESLIPFTFQPLERLGMIPQMRQSHFVKKYSVRFVQPDGGRSQPFYFSTRYDKDTIAQSWQVLRGARYVHSLTSAASKSKKQDHQLQYKYSDCRRFLRPVMNSVQHQTKRRLV